MDLVRFDQLLVLALFMAALGVAWLLVHRNRQHLSERLHRGRRLHLSESQSLGGNMRATLLAVDGREFLLVHGKAGVTALHALDPAPGISGGQS